MGISGVYEEGKQGGMYAVLSPQVVPVTAFGSTVVEARERRTS